LQKQPTASKPKIFDVYAIKSVDDLYTNGIFDLDQFFQGLERMAGIKKFCQLKMAPSEKIFEIISSFWRYPVSPERRSYCLSSNI